MPTKKPWRLCTRARLLLRGLRYARILPYASIDGWLTVDEAVTLFDLAASLPNERPLAVEIGCWQGKSSVCLASGLAGKNSPRLVCIDPFDAAGDAQSAPTYQDRANQLGSSLRASFEQNLTAHGLADLVQVQPGYSHQYAPQFQAPIDLLFLDGDHSEAAVRRDYEDWAPKIRPGGFLVLHDVVHPVHQGPRALVEQVIAGDPQWVDQRTVDSMFIARRRAAPG